MLFLLFALVSAHASTPAVEASLEKLAFRLELLRNQIDLMIQNNGSMKQDLSRQEHEFRAWDVYQRIPTKKLDAKTDGELLSAMQRDWRNAAADSRSGSEAYELKSLRLESKWKEAPKTTETAITYDANFRFPEEQLVDSREVEIRVEFHGEVPQKIVENPSAWVYRQQPRLRRLAYPAARARWQYQGNALRGIVTIYRYRDVQYPEILAPDLSHYASPSSATNSQSAVSKRIEKYRRDVIRLWPEVQPCLKTFRTFALNDLRMNFFLKHANVHPD
jgi:hypothetical protein